MAEGYYFWTGESDTRSITGNWQLRFQKLFTLAGIANAHPHRFRDTFSVALLLAGVPIEDVSILLGHSSVSDAAEFVTEFAQGRMSKEEARDRFDRYCHRWGTDNIDSVGKTDKDILGLLDETLSGGTWQAKTGKRDERTR